MLQTRTPGEELADTVALFKTGVTEELYLRAVGNDKERFSVDHKCLDVIGFADPQDVDVLDLDELVGRGVPFVNV